jgi:hypothetical protein
MGGILVVHPSAPGKMAAIEKNRKRTKKPNRVNLSLTSRGFNIPT